MVLWLSANRPRVKLDKAINIFSSSLTMSLSGLVCDCMSALMHKAWLFVACRKQYLES